MTDLRMLRGVSLAALASAMLASTPALAQDAEQATVDSIIVTAQKREQNLQDVPIVVTALTGEQLQNGGIKDIKDLQLLTPGLNVTSTTNETSTTARIRGVGTVGDNSGLESSVGVVIDGVYRPRNGVAYNDLGQLARIEVLKGPQGTLFGKNTSAGVINVITAAPTFQNSVRGEATFGNYGARGGSISVNGAIVQDMIAGNLYVAARQRDGYYDVITGAGPRTDKDDSDQNFVTTRGQLLITPNETARIRIIADYTNRAENCCLTTSTKRGAASQAALDATTPGGATALTPDPFARIARANRPTDQKIKDAGLSAQADVEIGSATLTSISAYRDWSASNALDVDFSNADVAYRTGASNTAFATLTQELRLAGRNEKVDWLVGGFFASERLKSGQDFRYGSAYEQYIGRLISQGLVGGAGAPNFVAGLLGRAPNTSFVAGQGQVDTYAQRGKSMALFTNNTIHVTQALDLSIGLRYTVEDKKMSSQQLNTDSGVGCATGIARASNGTMAGFLAGLGVPTTAIPAALPSILGSLCVPSWANPGFNNRVVAQSQEDKDLSGAIRAAYRFSPEFMTYASYARGFKAGGFNLDRTQGGAFAPTLPLPIVPQASTAFPAETVDSFEAGFKSTLLDRSLLLNATAFSSKFKNFQLNAFTGISFTVISVPEVTSYGVDSDFVWFTPISGLTAQGGLTYAVTEYGNDVVPGFPNLRNGRLSGAPMYSGSLAANYERGIGNGMKMLVNVGAKYSSSQNTGSDLDPNKVQDAFTLVNARVGIGGEDDQWSVEAFAANLFNTDYYQVVVGSPLQAGAFTAFLGAPRTYGVTLRAGF
jgi:iron complex outermembrane receptor protein